MEDSAVSELKALLAFKCLQNNEVQYVCCNPGCQNSPFICASKGCQCRESQKHQTCNIRNLEGISKRFTKSFEVSEQTEQSYRVIIELYDDLISKLEKDRESMRFKRKYHNFGVASQVLIQLVKNGVTKIKGKEFSEVIKQLEAEKQKNDELHLGSVEKQIDNFNKEFEALRNKVEKLNSPNMFSMYQKEIKGFFPQTKSVKGARLLFRASQHNFRTSEFHQLCDNIPHTLTLVKSEFQKVFGGYTPLAWNKNTNTYIHDPKTQSFIFSATQNRKFPLLNSQNAIFSHQNYGPTFSNGHDLYISDNCNSNKNNYCNFPSYYNSGNLQKSQLTYQLICGAKSGYNFAVQEYEVYELIFN